MSGSLPANINGASVRCAHAQVHCINEYELIRKYRCLACGEVMMCACDESRGREYLSHQLANGTDLDTQLDVPVTGGFQPNICRECRGEPLIAAPMAAIPGRTSKIKRYYWREIFFETERRMISAERRAGTSINRADVEKIVVDDLKDRHRTSPKYQYTERSTADVIAHYGVRVRDLKARYNVGAEKAFLIDDGGDGCSVEEFVASYFVLEGREVLRLESAPIHALFGVFMWLLVQDVADPRTRTVGFGSRTAFDLGAEGDIVHALLPEDFGARGYATRRRRDVERHFPLLGGGREDLLWLFDLWTDHSQDFRQYLWAHRDTDVVTARRLVEILTPRTTRRILRYLLEHYWGRYCGWPDLLVYGGTKPPLFVEVKSSRDSLSEEQKTWIEHNRAWLRLPFEVVKVHRSS